jgi:cyclic pyranopterin phosphate synthase
MKDSYQREIDYLRVSVTDRCNERCQYCMPKGYHGWAEKADHLSADEIVRLVEASTHLGFRKFRLTGGEPLVRRDIVEIAERMWLLPGVQTLGLSTNGVMLKELAQPLKAAGVRSINISLDAMDEAIYRQLTGGRWEAAMEGIGAAAAAGFEVVKLNCVMLKGINDEQIVPLARFGAAMGMPVRFIELMPLAPGGPVDERHFFSVKDAMLRLREYGELRPTQLRRPGHGPARYYQYGRGLVGFIGSVTCDDFCQSCNKLRLTADGKLRPCLGQHGEVDVTKALRENRRFALEQVFAQAIQQKPENHSFAENFQVQRPMTAIGG